MNSYIKTFPINLFVEGKSCLVCGGGKVATRKVLLLLHAGAKVTVIAPEITETLQKLAIENMIVYHCRAFHEDDCFQWTLVYSASDNSILNKHILDLCKSKKILCCSVDHWWKESNFMTPASIQLGTVMLTVSTGGSACKQSRILRDSLKNYLYCIKNIDIAVMGISYKELNFEQRDKYFQSLKDGAYLAEQLKQIKGILEFVIIITCNRFELHYVGSTSSCTRNLILHIIGLSAASKPYYKQGFAAFKHCSMLCSGLLSQSLGEEHITSQIKQAYAHAFTQGWAHSCMQEWIDIQLHTSKKIRQSVVSPLKMASLEQCVVHAIQSKYSHKDNVSVLLLGTGMIGSSLYTVLHKELIAARIIIFYNTSKVSPARSNGVTQYIQLLDLEKHLSHADVIISTLRVKEYILTQQHSCIIKSGALLIDISSPRSIDPQISLNGLSHEVINLDGILAQNSLFRNKEHMYHTQALNLIESCKDLYDKFVCRFTGWNT